MKTFKRLLIRLARFLRLLAEPETLDQLTDLAQKIKPRANPRLAESQKLILKDICSQARDTAGKSCDTLVLFTGVDSAEKATGAEVVAKDLKRDLYRIDLSRVVSKYIGETEKNLDRIFKAGDSAAAILFLDEAEALFGKRSEVKDAHDRYANLQIGYLLQQLESFKGVVVLSANRKENIPDAFRRRIRYVVDFPS